jgi:pyrimidine deaminase RibD-like protein
MSQRIGKRRAKGLLQKSIDGIEALKKGHYGSDEFTKWRRNTEITIENIFPEGTRHLNDYKSISYSPPAVPILVYRDGTSSGQLNPQPYYENGLNKAKAILESMVEEIETYWPDEDTKQSESPHAVKASKRFTDRELMERAIELARKCESEPGKVSPKVAAIVARDGIILGEAYRGEIKPGEHAEYTLFERKLANETLTGATLFTTLEPCTKRNDPKIACATRVVERHLGKVFIGTLDRNEAIRGKGEFQLQDAGIRIARFDSDLMPVLDELNRDFIRDIRSRTRAETTDPVDPNAVGPNGFKIGYTENGDKVEWIEEDGETWPLLLRRNDNDIVAEYNELWEKVWYVRKVIRQQRIDAGEIPHEDPNQPHLIKAAERMRQIEEKYGIENLLVDDIEWGIMQGKLSALAWAMGSDWEGSMDT